MCYDVKKEPARPVKGFIWLRYSVKKELVRSDDMGVA